MTNYVTARGVQQFSITIASGNTTATATINSVGSGAFILCGGINPSVAANPAEDFAYLTLTNPTTITATRQTGTTGTVVVTGCIVDGDTTNLIKSVQYGTITIATASTSGTATISAVTNTNTATHLLGWASGNTTFSANHEGPILSLSGTTVTATRPASTGALTVGFVIIEFQGTALNQHVQNVAATSSSSVTSYTVSGLSSVVAGNTICIYGGSSIATVSTNLAEYKQRGVLASSTTFTVNVNTAVADAKSYNCTIVEFVSGVLNSAVQRNTSTLTGVTSAATPLGTPINESYAGLSWLGNTTSATTAVLNEAEGAASLGTASPPAVSHVQGAAGTASTGTTCAATITSSTAGNLLAVGIVNSTGTLRTVTGVTDNIGQTYLQVPSAYATSTVSPVFSDIWYFPNTAAGVTTVTVTFSGSVANAVINVTEISGIALSSPVDAVSIVNQQATTLSPISAPITTSANNDFIFAVMGCQASSTTVSSPYAVVQSGSHNFGYYNIAASPVTSQTATVTLAVTEPYCFSTAAFLANTSLLQVVTVTKNAATANITASWEIFEFVPFFVPSFSASFTATASLAAAGSSLVKSTLTVSSAASFTAKGGSLAKSSISIASAGSFSPKGIAVKKATATWTGIGSYAPKGVPIAKGIATWAASAAFAAVGRATKKSSATWSSAATFAGIGLPLAKTTATWTGQATLAATGRRVISAVATWFAAGTTGFTGKSTATAISTWSPHAVFLAVGRPLAKTAFTVTPSGVFNATGRPLSIAIASWASHASLAASGLAVRITHFTISAVSALSVHPAGTHKATFAGSTTFSAAGQALKVSAATWTASAHLSAVGQSHAVGTAVITPHATLAATGAKKETGTATISAIGSLAAIGASLRNTVLSITASSAFAPRGGARVTRAATWTASSTLAADSAATRTGTASFIPEAALVADGAARKTAAVTVHAATSLTAAGGSRFLGTVQILARATVAFARLFPPTPCRRILDPSLNNRTLTARGILRILKPNTNGRTL
ncbi:Glycoprotein gp2 [Fimbriiglobus ruber]|uniref:Glycoprotein gp2 n=1 Tax=Fimbriiglobus ruber TaxID=1908690 RepID=A0A225DXP0_9BACT|nr:Glycoprotein gp2 [Fimbriiglobus ruber]